jgi:hypothetical protein
LAAYSTPKKSGLKDYTVLFLGGGRWKSGEEERGIRKNGGWWGQHCLRALAQAHTLAVEECLRDHSNRTYSSPSEKSFFIASTPVMEGMGTDY